MKNLLFSLLLLTTSLLAEEKFIRVDSSQLAEGIHLEKSLELAQAVGAKIAFDLTDAELVKKFRERILALLETYIDVVSLSEKEAYALTQLPPDKSALFLKNFCPLVIIQSVDQGYWICSNKGLSFSSEIPSLQN